MAIAEEKFSFGKEALSGLRTTFAIEEIAAQLSLAEADIQRRKQQSKEIQDLLARCRNNDDEQLRKILERDANMLAMLLEDTNNMKTTESTLSLTLDKKLERVIEMKQTFADVFINFDVDSKVAYKFIITFSKKLFHGKFLEQGPIREEDVISGFWAFLKNVISLNDKRFFVSPIFRYKGDKLINAIQTTSWDAFYDGNAPVRLIEAAKIGDEQKLKFYLDIGVDVNVKDKKGETALHWAARNNKVNASILLINNGGNWELKNKKKQTPESLASYNLRVAVQAVRKKARQASDSRENSDNNNTRPRSFSS